MSTSTGVYLKQFEMQIIKKKIILQRIGRTGRVGNTGRATSFFDERENAGLARPLVKVTHNLFMLSASDIIPLVSFTVMAWLNC